MNLTEVDHMKNIALIGEGGHFNVIQDIISETSNYKIIAIFDDKYKTLHQKNGLYFGPVSTIHHLMKKLEFKLLISIGDNRTRKNIAEKLNLHPDYYETIIHPSAIISKHSIVGKGTVIMPHVIVNANSVIGNHVILNTSSIIEHDNRIEDFVHISPAATLTGNVNVAEGTHIGAGATVIPRIKVGEWAIVGAGSTVIHDLQERCVAVGSPARIIKSLD